MEQVQAEYNDRNPSQLVSFIKKTLENDECKTTSEIATKFEQAKAEYPVRNPSTIVSFITKALENIGNVANTFYR